MSSAKHSVKTLHVCTNCTPLPFDCFDLMQLTIVPVLEDAALAEVLNRVEV